MAGTGAVRVATTGSGSGSRVPILRELAAGVELKPYKPRLPGFPRTAYDRLLADLAFLDVAERAAGDGCDAILVDTTCDFGWRRRLPRLRDARLNERAPSWTAARRRRNAGRGAKFPLPALRAIASTP